MEHPDIQILSRYPAIDREAVRRLLDRELAQCSA